MQEETNTVMLLIVSGLGLARAETQWHSHDADGIKMIVISPMIKEYGMARS